MCGITGIFSYVDGPPVSSSVLRRMTDRLVHRGPDGEGYHLDEPRVALGHRRLSIVDKSGGAQPLSNEDGSIWVTFNGEIYNHEELRRGLVARGHVFRSRSDTEVLVHLYEELGDDLPRELNGEFAFAIWDARRRRIVVARDRLGVKPVFYFDDGRSLVFASELGAILAHPDAPREIDSTALVHYLHYQYVPGPASIVSGVHKLPPATILSCDLGGPARTTTYWRCPFGESAPPLAPREAEEALLEHLRRSVKMRLMSDVPLGAFLSGGVDSSAIVATMTEAGASPVRTFTIGFPEASYNEADEAFRVASHFRTRHTEHILRPSPEAWAEAALGGLNEPLADVSCLPTYQVCRLARESVTVCLSGDGADELFAGYERLRASRFERAVYQRLPRWMRTRIASSVARLRPGAEKKGWRNVLGRFACGAALPDRGRQMRWQTFADPETLGDLLSSDFHARTADVDLWSPVERIADRVSGDELDRELAVETGLYLADDVLAKVDRMSMACSLEARPPFLDHHLVEFAARLPAADKLGWTGGKRLLRRALRGVLPRRTLRRAKQGFGLPLKHWLRHELHAPVAAAFAGPHADLDGRLDAGSLRNLLETHRTGERDHSHLLWSLYVLIRWREAVQNAGDVARPATVKLAPPARVERRVA